MRQRLSKLQEDHLHHLTAGVRSAEGLPLLHKEAYSTLNYVTGKNEGCATNHWMP